MKRVSTLLSSWERPKTVPKNTPDHPWPYIHSPALFQQPGALTKGDTQNWARQETSQIECSFRTSEAKILWPTTLDKESEKAARILYSFCKTGFQSENFHSPVSPTDNPPLLKRIPEKVIQEAAGLAIFTTTRAGLWISGAGGSGVLIARRDNGEWSPPSGILLHTSRLAFLGGIDTYDCVLVINDQIALESFAQLQLSLSKDVHVADGPLKCVGDVEDNGSLQSENRSSIFTYFKSRGFHASPQIEGTVIIERNDENERFYGQKIGVADIITGKIRHLPYELGLLMDVIRLAEGHGTTNEKDIERLSNQPCLGDLDVQSSRSPCFGIPEAEDPDPYGVMALEKAGFEIRESGTRSRPSSSQFEYHPSLTSPVFARFNRMSIDTLASRSNRGSCISARTRTSIDRATQTEEIATPSDHLASPNTSPSLSNRTFDALKCEDKSNKEPEENETSIVHRGSVAHSSSHISNRSTSTQSRRPNAKISRVPSTRKNTTIFTDESEGEAKDEDFESEFEDEDEEPVIYEASSAMTTIIRPASNARGGLVNIPKRPKPPPVPARSASRRLYQVGSSSPRKDPFESKERSVDRTYHDQRIISPIRMANFPLPELRENVEESPSRKDKFKDAKEYLNER